MWASGAAQAAQVVRIILRWRGVFRAFASLEELRESVETLEDTARTARRVLGGAHPTTTGIEKALRNARAVLSARKTPSPRRTISTQRIKIGEPKPTGIKVEPAVLMFAFAVVVYLCFEWGASPAPAPRAPEL